MSQVIYIFKGADIIDTASSIQEAEKKALKYKCEFTGANIYAQYSNKPTCWSPNCEELLTTYEKNN